MQIKGRIAIYGGIIKIKYFQEEKSKYQDWSGEDDPRTNWNDTEKLKLEYNSTLYALNKFLNVDISDIEIGRTYKVIINNNEINDIINKIFYPKPKHDYIIYYCKDKNTGEEIKLDL